jgi:hypothetical protein
MNIMSDYEERVWKYLLSNPGADADDIAAACNVSIGMAQSCLARVGTPRDVLLGHLKPTRVQTLETAINLTGGDRNKAYGPPFNNLSDCASLWNAYINTKYKTTDELKLDAEDVAWMMVLLKMTRSFQPGYHADNYTDATAYAAIAGECREIQIKEDKA